PSPVAHYLVRNSWPTSNEFITLRNHSHVENALDHLWRVQFTLGPLIKVMPPDLWTYTNADEIAPVVTFIRPLIETDFVRFDHYASKVKDLRLGLLCLPKAVEVHEDVLCAFAIFRPARLFLPNVEKLFVGAMSGLPPHHLCYYPCLLNNSITSITMNFKGASDPEALSILSAMARLCPKIEYLMVSNLSHRSSLAFNDIVLHFFHLKSLAGHCGVSFESARHLGTLTSLSKWKIEGSMDDISGHSPDLELFKKTGLTTENGRFSAPNKMIIKSTS
ncbi:hypothetical protein H0H93_012675, partial [Arthromyces matolae]